MQFHSPARSRDKAAPASDALLQGCSSNNAGWCATVRHKYSTIVHLDTERTRKVRSGVCSCTRISELIFRYHPDDLPTRIVQKQLKDTQAKCTGERPQHTIEYLTSWFTEIVTKRHRPVMRYFFREKHKEPTAWFATRLNYTRSVAVTSIVGHVLGLGDRHLSNILLDQHNGEVVHIDLGIAFDQVGYD